jgi:hypothetical protein
MEAITLEKVLQIIAQQIMKIPLKAFNEKKVQ